MHMSEFIATVVGAFLASIFGLIGSILIWHYQNIKDRKIIIKTIHAELTNLKTSLQRIQASIDQGIIKPGMALQFTFLKYETFSLERQKLYSFIPSDEMITLESVFSTFKQYDQLLKESPRQVEGSLQDSIVVFWSFYQAQYQANLMNINQCIQYLNKII